MFLCIVDNRFLLLMLKRPSILNNSARGCLKKRKNPKINAAQIIPDAPIYESEDKTGSKGIKKAVPLKVFLTR